jgi:hypothetical protein
MADKCKRTKADLEALKYKLLVTMTRHVGPAHKIGMGELYEKITGESYDNRINGTRVLRRLITELRREGTPIVSDVHATSGGYYLAAAVTDMQNYCSRLRAKALKALALEAKIRNLTLPDLVGQVQMELGAGMGGGAA